MRKTLLKLAQKDSRFRRTLITAMRRKKEIKKIDPNPKLGSPEWKIWEREVLQEVQKGIPNLRWEASGEVYRKPSVSAHGEGDEKHLLFIISPSDIRKTNRWWMITVYYDGPEVILESWEEYIFEKSQLFTEGEYDLRKAWLKVQQKIKKEWRDDLREILIKERMGDLP